MPQKYVSDSGDQAVDSCQLMPVQGSADLYIYGGERFRQKICFCLDQFSITELSPGALSAELSEVGCLQAGDAIKIWCHEEGCESGLLNGEHEVTAVSGDVVVLGNTDMSLLGSDVQTFKAQPVPVGCLQAEPLTPPSACHTRDLSNIEFSGLIRNRLDGQCTRIALTAYTTSGSDIVYVTELGEVHEGDEINIPAAGITGATVLRMWQEQALINDRPAMVDYLQLDQSANYTGCAGASTEAGVLAEFEFSEPALGCVEMSLSPSVTRRMPAKTDSSKCGCDPGCYQVGIYSVFAEYYSGDSRVERELLVHGCVYYCPTSYSQVA